MEINKSNSLHSFSKCKRPDKWAIKALMNSEKVAQETGWKRDSAENQRLIWTYPQSLSWRVLNILAQDFLQGLQEYFVRGAIPHKPEQLTFHRKTERASRGDGDTSLFLIQHLLLKAGIWSCLTEMTFPCLVCTPYLKMCPSPKSTKSVSITKKSINASISLTLI